MTNPIPAQLPAAVADFTGRKVQVAGLIQELAEHRVMVISAVSGMGGVGKTALAVHVGHQVRARFPDGQLFADLQGASDHPADPSSVLRVFLRALGIAESSMPADVDARAALYRSILAARRVLIVLDNALNADQVAPLLPGEAGCAVLVTSRARLPELTGARHVGLEVLALDEAVHLLGRIAGAARIAAEPEAARQVVKACGLLPLAIRIAGCRLATRPGWSVADLAGRLADEHRLLHELQAGDIAVKAVFALGHGQLTEEQSRAFRLLAVPESPWLTPATAAALLNIGEIEAGELLESLVDAGLLDSRAPGRYGYHDLLRAFAHTIPEAEPGEREAAFARLLDHYLAACRNFHRVFRPGNQLSDLVPRAAPEPGFADGLAAYAWLDAEHTAVLAAIQQACRSAEAPVGILGDLVMVLDQLIAIGTAVPELAHVAQQVAEAARAAGDARAESRALHTVAWARWELRALAEAENAFRRHLALETELKQMILHNEAAVGLALVLSEAGRGTESAALLDRLAVETAADDGLSGNSILLSFIAMAYTNLGRHDLAEPIAARSLAGFEQLGDLIGMVHACYFHGVALRGLGARDEALGRLQQTLELLRLLGSREREPEALLGIAEIHADAGRWADALATAEEALVIADGLRRERWQAMALALIGHARAALGEPEAANEATRRATEIFERLEVSEVASVKALLREPS